MRRGSHFYRNCLAIGFSGPYSVLIMKTGINSSFNLEALYRTKETAVAQWLRCCATNRKIAGSIPVGVTGIFH